MSSPALQETASGPSPARAASLRPVRRRLFGFTADDGIQAFFGGNALLSIVVLLLIMVLLLREGSGFLPLNAFNLSVYRQAGLEYVDILRAQVDAGITQGRVLPQIRQREIEALVAQGVPLAEANARLAAFDHYAESYSDALDPHRALLSDLTDLASALKQKAADLRDRQEERASLLRARKTDEAAALDVAPIDFPAELAPIRATLPDERKLDATLAASLRALAAPDAAPALALPADRQALAAFQKSLSAYAATFPAAERKMEGWNPEKPIPFYRPLTSFLFGTRWLTASFWQDWYGVIPLFVGSLAASFVALVIAVPLAVGAAIYVNQIAGARERDMIKPCIEFIAAIPSVVLGFFGIAVLGASLRTLSQQAFLAWVPFFPMREQLTIFTAGALLALMAIPTIFTLAEDALNNVPRSFVEASTALGANRLQTVVRILCPAALSGIVSAILLGLGRVIGETMVVLLCIGGRTEIPDFLHHGLGAFFEPAHTMTGIIAQEMGEAVKGTILHRALFMVGVLLFFISLAINFGAQKIVKKYKISIG